MKKKKKIVDLKSLNINYEQNNLTYKLIYLKTASMTVEVGSYKGDKFIENITIPFAHLAKSIKQKINPVK